MKEALKELNTNSKKLKGFEAVYTTKTETGRTGTIKQGAHFKSGWSYISMDLRESDGRKMVKTEFWKTNKGRAYMKLNEQIIVFDEFVALMKGAQKITDTFRFDESSRNRVIAFSFNLDREHIKWQIGQSPLGLQWAIDPDRLVSQSDEEFVFESEEEGSMTIDRSNGVLISQTIEMKEGNREMKLVSLDLHPDEKDIAGKMKFDPATAQKKPLPPFPIVGPILHHICQGLIEKTSKDPKFEEHLENALVRAENDIVTFLHHQPVSPVREKTLISNFGTLDRIRDDLSKTVEAINEEIVPEEFMKTEEFRHLFLKKIAHGNAKKLAGKKRETILKNALREELTAEGPKEAKARTLIEDTILRAYLRVDMEKSLALYLEE